MTPSAAAPWRFTGTSDRGDIELLLPQDPPITLGPRGYLVLVKDRTLFLSRFSVPASVQVLEWGVGSLSDAGDSDRAEPAGRPG